MAFMEPEYDHGVFYEVENRHGESTLVPGDLVGNEPHPEDFADYIENGNPASFNKVKGWFVRLQAPGYMDATEWSGPFKTEEAARQHVIDFWEVDPDTGDELGDEEAENLEGRDDD